jgi:hypothetical protein
MRAPLPPLGSSVQHAFARLPAAGDQPHLERVAQILMLGHDGQGVPVTPDRSAGPRHRPNMVPLFTLTPSCLRAILDTLWPAELRVGVFRVDWQ